MKVSTTFENKQRNYRLDTHFVLLFQDLTDFSFNSFGDVIDVLRFDGGLHPVFEDFGKIVLKLTSAEMNQYFFPIRRSIIATQVRFQFSGQDFDSCRLSDTVRSNESKNLTRTRHWETMEFERIGSVSMRRVSFQIFWQINNGNGFKWALFGTNAAT
jgi:hypothetical protein